jgi:fused signal recognition particle receptor
MFNIFKKNNTPENPDNYKNTINKKQNWLSKLPIIFSKNKLTDQDWEELEEILISSDAGYSMSQKIIDLLRKEIQSTPNNNVSHLEILREVLITQLEYLAPESEAVIKTPYVILVVGINGVGKTTSIAKLASYFKQSGKSVLLSAGDTFRAAAAEQLEYWADKVGVDIVKQPQGSDPGSVVFDSYQAARARNIDILLIDTAGRMNNKSNLMEELTKIKRVLTKNDPDAPHEVILILDATTGLNGLEQAKSFNEAVQCTGVFLTKLDGTSKGGIVLAVKDQLNIPILFIGTGESMADIAYFEPVEFVDAMLEIG